MSDKISKWNVANHFTKRKLLIAINSIAGLSIFFFGYDQGMMGGVNQAKGANKAPGHVLIEGDVH